MPFQNPPAINLEGEMSCTVVDPTGNPLSIIPADQAWAIDVDWTLLGTGWEMVGGHWVVHANLESIGPGDEIRLHDSIDPDCGTAGSGPALPSVDGSYHCHFDVPASVITDAMAGHDSVMMKLVVTVTYRDMHDNWSAMAGYCDEGIIQFFKD